MPVDIQDKLAGKQNLVRLLIGILVLGSLWGLSEVVVSGGLRAAAFPYRSGLLTGIGMGIMGLALFKFRKPAMLFGIGLVAALVNTMVVPILGVSIMCKANSCLAVATESASLALVAVILMRKMDGNIYTRMGGAGLAALVASASFYFMGLRVAPCNYLLSFVSPQSFVITEGLVWTAFSAILFPLGYLAGQKLEIRPLPALKGRFYYGATAGTVAFAWGISALAISAGL